MRETLTEADEGNASSPATATREVVSVDGGAAYVDPDPGIAARLGWTDRDDDSYRVDPADVATITDDEVRLSA